MSDSWQRMPIPPIELPQAPPDQYAKSKLMTYRRSRERQKMLNNIVLVSCMFLVKFILSSF